MIALIVRVDADSGISHYGFRTGGGYDYVLVGSLSVFADEISEVIELALCLLVDNLLVADGGLSYRIPVDHSHSAIDHPLLVEIHEGIDNCLAQSRFHSETGAVPVAGRSEFSQLLEDDSSVLFLPLPGFFQELLPGQGSFLYSPFP